MNLCRISQKKPRHSQTRLTTERPPPIVVITYDMFIDGERIKRQKIEDDTIELRAKHDQIRAERIKVEKVLHPHVRE